MRRVLVVFVVLAACAAEEAPPPPAPRAAVSGPPDRMAAAMELAHQVAQRYGRFGGVEDVSVAPDGRAMLVAVRDHPSHCLCDRERGIRDRGRGVALVEPRGERPPDVRYLVEEEHVDHQVAASREHLAVAAGSQLRVWRRGALAEPVVHRLPSHVRELAWLPGGRWLVASTHDRMIVLDVATGVARARRYARVPRVRTMEPIAP